MTKDPSLIHLKGNWWPLCIDFSAEAWAWPDHFETCDWSFGRPRNMYPYFGSKLVERELRSQANGDEHIALGTVQVGSRMCLHVCSQGSLLMLLPEIRWTSLPCHWQGWTSTSPWHRNSPQMTQNWPNASVLQECKSPSRKGKELGSVYPSKLSISVSCSSPDVWCLLIVSDMKQSPPLKPAAPHLPTSTLAVLSLET